MMNVVQFVSVLAGRSIESKSSVSKDHMKRGMEESITLVQKTLPSFKQFCKFTYRYCVCVDFTHVIPLVPYYKMTLRNIRTYSHWT